MPERLSRLSDDFPSALERKGFEARDREVPIEREGGTQPLGAHHREAHGIREREGLIIEPANPVRQSSRLERSIGEDLLHEGVCLHRLEVVGRPLRAQSMHQVKVELCDDEIRHHQTGALTPQLAE